MIGSILALSSCNEVKFSGDAGEGTGTVTAGFRDSVITIFENMGTGSVGILAFPSSKCNACPDGSRRRKYAGK